ncbi:hypothetical protein [Nocardia iowensis]|uniref:DUF4062 domain-containing protein n=1 Tax=Nocardia iowensis TaxID=204891 RepID=A0ABX8RYC2_NOCIO|nr:hypothetical protein [Nocardia iowensis]QXN94558.1 hypothetical protein KV110_16800 [Nocardia iowensis]
MVFAAHVLKVMISSPGDTADEVQAVIAALHGWNSSRAESAETVLLPRFWKADAVPQLGTSSGQGVINSQLLDEADIVIALFDARLGQETDSAVSGTAEEIERASAAGKPVHVWFSDEPVDRRKIDITELGRLQSFREELQSRGLLGVYTDLSDLAYRVRDAVESDISRFGLGAPSVVRKGEHALPRLRVERDVDYRGKSQVSVILENKSETVTAKDLSLDLGPWEHAVYRESHDPFDLPPLQSLRWTAGFDMGMPTQITATITWTEDSAPQSVDLPVTSR